MNLKTFAQKSRNILMEGVAQKVLYWGFDAKGNVVEEPTPVGGGYLFRGNIYDDPTGLKLWQALRSAIKKKGVKEVVETAAYTWFNRMMAIRILSANKYEPLQLEYASNEVPMPQMLQRARRGQYEYLSDSEKKRLQAIITDYSQDNQSFAILLVGYCHTHPLLQSVFGGINDYTELLLPDNILAINGFVHLLNTTDAITEEECQKVELIGWLYQYYISDRKDEVFAGFKQNKKAEAKDIPAATQIFTPNWIVKYMVENTVGKLWLDLHPDSPIKNRMKYLVEGTNPEYGNPIISEIEQLKLLDPAVGSGHILVEGFDLLYEMYIEDFASPEEAVESILKNNLFGLDIDKRAVQLASFAILLKAAKKHRDILKKGILPRIYAMPESYTFSRQEVLDFLGEAGRIYEEPLTKALKLMEDAQNIGSIIRFDLNDATQSYIIKRISELETKKFKSFSEEVVLPNIRPYIQILDLLTQKYEAIAANPPYMGRKNMNSKQLHYIDTNYPESKGDLMTVFMELSLNKLHEKGSLGMINLPSWMFIASFEKLRSKILQNQYIRSLIHNGRGVFGSDFGSVAFCIDNEPAIGRKGVYRRLFKEHVKVDSVEEKERKFFNISYGFYDSYQENFLRLPGAPVAYWVSEKTIKLFDGTLLGEISFPKSGLSSTDNTQFLRFWNEVNFNKIGLGIESHEKGVESGKKWFPYNKGGIFRKWYGNNDYVVNWRNDGEDIRACIAADPKKQVGGRIVGYDYYFKSCISWGDVTSGSIAVKKINTGFLFDSVGISVFNLADKENYILGLINSKPASYFLTFLCPTIHFNPGGVAKIPIIQSQENIDHLIEENIEISKKDWDSREFSWNFLKSPILNYKTVTLKEAYNLWVKDITHDFFKLHANEEALNSKFINIYGFQEELDCNVQLKNVTILQDELDYSNLELLEPIFFEKGKDAISLPIKRDLVMKQLISYSIGIGLGRYRLDKPGINIAHPISTEDELSSYNYNGHFIEIDNDGIIPLMGRTCQFNDNTYQQLLKFLEANWGADNLTQNLNFLQDFLNQDLEKYLVKNFWKDHVQMYKKKPIYWLFASPKGAFQVLVYMHRMNRFTVEKIRSNYLIEYLKHLRFQISQLENRIVILNRDEARLLDKLRADLMECEAYDMLLKNKADQQIELDLDNGVTANYELFKGVVAPIK